MVSFREEEEGVGELLTLRIKRPLLRFKSYSIIRIWPLFFGHAGEMSRWLRRRPPAGVPSRGLRGRGAQVQGDEPAAQLRGVQLRERRRQGQAVRVRAERQGVQRAIHHGGRR